MTFEENLDLQILFAELYEKCKTIEEVEKRRDELEDFSYTAYEERIDELGGYDNDK